MGEAMHLADEGVSLADIDRAAARFGMPMGPVELVDTIGIDVALHVSSVLGRAFNRPVPEKLSEMVKQQHAFVVNRVLAPYMGEAMHLADEGVSLADIDRAAARFGMPMGPVELVDTIGIDVALHVSSVLGRAFNRPVPEKLSEMVKQQHLGRKSGQGFYRWKDGKAVKSESGTASGAGPSDIEDRLMLPMVNEAIACLSEGVVKDADLLDAGVIFGTGFAPFRGGPLQYARDRGIEQIEQILHGYQERFGDRYRPHAGWKEFH